MTDSPSTAELLINTMPGVVGTLVAAYAIGAARRDAARREAAGLHADMYLQGVEVPEGLDLPNEPGPWSDADMVIKLTNSSMHPYYSVMASVFLNSRQQRMAARAPLVSPGTTMYATVGSLDGCDLVPMDEGVQVHLTFVDSTGKGWRRDNRGRLRRIRGPRWRDISGHRINARPSLSAAMHGVREVTEFDPEIGDDLTLPRDRKGHPTEVHEFLQSKTSDDTDALAHPGRIIDIDSLKEVLGDGVANNF